MDLKGRVFVGGGEGEEGFAGEDGEALVVAGVEEGEGFVGELGEEVEEGWAGEGGAGVLGEVEVHGGILGGREGGG